MITLALFVIVTSVLVLDLGITGVNVLRLSRDADNKEDESFIRGIGLLLTTMAVINLFWLTVVLAGEYSEVLANALVRQVAVTVILAAEITLIVVRRRWWDRLSKLAANGVKSNTGDEALDDPLWEE